MNGQTNHKLKSGTFTVRRRADVAEDALPSEADVSKRLRGWVAPLDRLTDQQLHDALAYRGPEVSGSDEGC